MTTARLYDTLFSTSREEEAMAGLDPKASAQALAGNPCLLVGFLNELSGAFDERYGKKRKEGATKVAQALRQATAAIERAELKIVAMNIGNADLFEPNREARFLAVNYIEYPVLLAQLLCTLADEFGEPRLKVELKAAGRFVQYADTVLKRTTKPKSKRPV